MKLHYIILIGLIAITSSSCYESEEGCLDAVAVNFDVTADDDCCCEYPKLVLEMSHLFGEDPLTLGADLVNDINSPFEIISFQYYLSGFSLFDESNNDFSITSIINLPQLSGDNVETPDDFVLMRRSLFRDSLGFFPTFGSYERLEFEIGVKEVAQNTNPEAVDDSHPLAIQTDSMWFENEHYASTRIVIKPDTVDISDTFTITIFDNTLVSLDSELELSSGAHINLRLQTDYAVWFNGVDFQNDSQQAIQTKVNSNLANSLSFFID